MTTRYSARRTKPPHPIVVNALPPVPVEEPARSAEAWRRGLTELLRLSRYEHRAISRRDRAIREMVKAKTSKQSLLGRRPILQTAKPACVEALPINECPQLNAKI